MRDEERHSRRRRRRGDGHHRRHPRRCSRCARRCSNPATKCWCRTRSGRRPPATSWRRRRVPVPLSAARITRLAARRGRNARDSSRRKTRAIYVNSPQQPDRRRAARARTSSAIAALARERNLWVFSDEAYEDVVFDGRTHLSIASLPGMYERTIPLYTFSKTYAMTGLRLGYLAVTDPRHSRPRRARCSSSRCPTSRR